MVDNRNYSIIGLVKSTAIWWNTSLVEQFFKLDQVKEDTKVPLVSVHLEGKALAWRRRYMKNRGEVSPTWDQYVEDLTSRFGEPYNDPIAELVELKQTGTIAEYHDLFDEIISRLQLAPAYVLSCFIAGLEEDIRNFFKICNFLVTVYFTSSTL
nr:hypothetical protein [Tanacetum cinerariifolium]